MFRSLFTPHRHLVRARCALLLFFALVAAPHGAAQEDLAGLAERVTLHGFGGWAVGFPDGNAYLGAYEDPDYDERNFALNVSAEATERLRVVAQFHWETSIVDPEEIDDQLDYAFADWALHDNASFRVGVVQQPFGIYTEVFDVGTIRPFYSLPQSIYGPVEVVARSYTGLGFTGSVGFRDHLDLAWDAYGGEIDMISAEAANPFLGIEGFEPESIEKLSDLVGGRVALSDPLRGWTVGLSAYSGAPEEEEDEGEAHEAGQFIADFQATDEEIGPGSDRQEVFGLFASYLGAAWEVRAEYVQRRGGIRDVAFDGSYLEAAYRFNRHWQLAGRWEQADEDEGGDKAEHEVIAASLNYWFSSNFVARLAVHEVEGLLLVVPEDFETPETDTQLVRLGFQFSF